MITLRKVVSYLIYNFVSDLLMRLQIFFLYSQLTEVLGIFTGLVLLDLYCLLYQKLLTGFDMLFVKTLQKNVKAPREKY